MKPIRTDYLSDAMPVSSPSGDNGAEVLGAVRDACPSQALPSGAIRGYRN